MDKELIQDEIDRYSRKAFSTRLPEDHLLYFLKYAQEFNTKGISDTFLHMIEKLAKHEPLNDVEFRGELFKNQSERNKVTKKYLGTIDIPEKKKELSLGEVKLPEERRKEEDDDEGEEVFTI